MKTESDEKIEELKIIVAEKLKEHFNGGCLMDTYTLETAVKILALKI